MCEQCFDEIDFPPDDYYEDYEEYAADEPDDDGYEGPIEDDEVAF